MSRQLARGSDLLRAIEQPDIFCAAGENSRLVREGELQRPIQTVTLGGAFAFAGALRRYFRPCTLALMIAWLAHLLTELRCMADHIRDRVQAALHSHHSNKDRDRGASAAIIAWLVLILECVLWIGDAVFAQSRENKAGFHLIERLERKIMAADDEVVAEIQSMADAQTAQSTALAGMSTNIDAVLAQLAAGNTQGATDEAAKLKAALDPVKATMDSNAAALQAAADKLSSATTPPAPAPAPPADAASRSGGKSNR